MAYTLPNEDAPSVALEKGFTQGSNLYNMLMQHALAKRQAANQEAINAREAQLFPLKQAHLAALTNSAQSNADWNNMLLGRPSSFNGSQGQARTTPEEMPSNNYNAVKSKFPQLGAEQQQLQPQQIGEEIEVNAGNPALQNMDRFAGLKGVPPVQTHYDTNGNLISRYPSGKITMQKIAPSAMENKKSEQVLKLNSETIKEINKTNVPLHKLDSAFARFDKLLSDPEWDKMNNNFVANNLGDYGRKANLEYYKNKGTDKQKDLIARIEKQSNEIIADMASSFKGSFRLFEKDIIDKMKPQVWDTPVAARAKLAEMRRASETQKFINKRGLELMKNQGMDSNEAFSQAYDESESDEFLKSLEEKYGQKSEGQTLEEKYSKSNQEGQANSSSSDAFLKSVSALLIKDFPDATPEAIKQTAIEEKKSPEQVVQELIAIQKARRGNK